MISRLEQLDAIALEGGWILKELGGIDHLNAVHWNLPDGALVPRHHHPQEQFGYVIRGGFRVQLGDEMAEIHAGDCYFVPADLPHEFVALGDTEAIDVFSPTRDVLSHEAPVSSAAAAGP